MDLLFNECAILYKIGGVASMHSAQRAVENKRAGDDVSRSKLQSRVSPNECGVNPKL